ncbi:MAG: SDR family oxidoreductase [Flavobacteriaceae bacterium]
MDLGIADKVALVCGSSAGLGLACAEELAREGASVVLVGRDGERLRAAAERVGEIAGALPRTVRADVATPEGRASILAACPAPDILINNAGGPPRKDFRELTVDDWRASMDANFIASVEMIRETVDQMIGKRWGRIVNITSLTARMPVEKMDMSTSARLALAGYVAGVSRQIAESGVTINNLLPGTFATERLKAVGQTGDQLGKQVPMRRAGDPREFGAICAFLCSVHAGYVTGQNWLADGGLVPVTI